MTSTSQPVRSMKVAWLKRDILLFANSIGVRAGDLHLLYELHPNFQALPTYPIVLSQKGETQEVVDFYADFNKNQGFSGLGLPKLDSKRMVDAGRTMYFYRPIPTSSQGRSFELRIRVAGIYDKGRAGTVVEVEMQLVDMATDETYVKIVGNQFYLGQGNWGGPKGPKTIAFNPPDRRPDFVETIQTTPETPLLYRLNGDTNPLHATPEPGIAMGYSGNIIHGLYTYNATFSTVLRLVGKSNPARICQFESRFASAVSPGDKLIVEVWKLSNFNKQGYEEIRFVVKGRDSKAVLTNGRALVKPAQEEQANL